MEMAARCCAAVRVVASLAGRDTRTPTMTADAGDAREAAVPDFASFGLDARMLRVLTTENLTTVTPIQEEAIPLAFMGKDILAKAPTGSGKTLAYLVPILQQLIGVAEAPSSAAPPAAGGCVQALILVPTRELARQVTERITTLLHYCSKALLPLNLCGEESVQLQRSLLAGSPAIVVSTPSRILTHLDGGSVSLTASLRYLVIDEADLILSFGYAADLERIAREYTPRTVQTFLMSATLSEDIEALKKLILRNPVILKVDDATCDGEGRARMEQYTIRCSAEDRFLVMYVALKVGLLKGKLLIFTSDIETSFKLKLFLDQFGIATCILNAELPALSRHHIVDEYNRGVYDVIIASDIQGVSSAAAGTEGKEAEKRVKKRGASSLKVKSDNESGVSRGVDFKRIDVVVNFDMPNQVDTYVHRIGRTARGTASGTAISFVCTNDDERILAAIEADQVKRGSAVLEHAFDVRQLEGFRYRCADALRSITRTAIKTARLQAVKDELLKSERLKVFFSERPADLAFLRHDRSSKALKVREEMKNAPVYLLPIASEQHTGVKRGKLTPLPQILPANSAAGSASLDAVWSGGALPQSYMARQKKGKGGARRKDSSRDVLRKVRRPRT